MDTNKDPLISTFKKASKSGWSLQSDVQVLKWLEDFAERLKRRASNVTGDVHELLDQTDVIEQDLYNTFNSFRALSNSQYIENRIHDDDEMTGPNADFSVNILESSLPAQGYEEDIVPRYKEALQTGWNAYRQYIQKTSRKTTQLIPQKVKWNNRQLPHIIGTEEYMQDNSCGLTEDRNMGMDPIDFSSDVESEGIHLAAEMGGTRTLIEADWYGTDSDKDDQVWMEPAVSAALDFKAMLEAALRSSYMPGANDGDITNLNDNSSYTGKTAGGLVASQVTLDGFRGGSTNVSRKSSDILNSLNPTDKNQEESQIYDTIATASTSTGTISGDLAAKGTNVSEGIPAILRRNMTSESIGDMNGPESSSYSRKIYKGAGSGFHSDSPDKLPNSSQIEYQHLISQPGSISQAVEHAKLHEKLQWDISTQSDQLSTSLEGKNNIDKYGSSLTGRKFDAAVISGHLLYNEGEPSNSYLYESDLLLSPPTVISQSSTGKDDDEKIVSRSISKDKVSNIPKEQAYHLSSSSSSSRHLYGALFSGGLFDDEDELINSSPVESVNVWLEPSVPDNLFCKISEPKKDDVMQSSSISRGLIHVEPNPLGEMSYTNIQVSGDSKHQFSEVQNIEQTAHSNDNFDKQYGGYRSLKESLSLFHKGLFDDGDSDEDDIPGDLFSARSLIGQKQRLHDGDLVNDSNVVEDLSNPGIAKNIPNEMCTSLPEPHKDDDSHNIDAGSLDRTETTSPIGNLLSSISNRVENTAVESEMPTLDESKEPASLVNMTLKYALSPEKGTIIPSALPWHKDKLFPHVVPDISLEHSDNESDSWSSSISDKSNKQNEVLITNEQASSDFRSEINNDELEKNVLEATSLHVAGDSASPLQDSRSANLAECDLRSEPTNAGIACISQSKEDISQLGTSLPLSSTEFESFSSAAYLEESRVEITTTLASSSVSSSEANTFENYDEVTRSRVEDQAVKLKTMDIPKRTGSHAGTLQLESLGKYTDVFGSSSEELMNVLNDESKDGHMVLAKSAQAPEGASGNTINQDDLKGVLSTSMSNEDLRNDTHIGPSGNETKYKFSNVISEREGLDDTTLSAPPTETKAPSRFTLLFGDDDEEMELFGPLPKTNPNVMPHRTPGKHPSLFGNDED